MTVDPRAFRVNLICSCQNDIAYGYGPSVLDARYIAEAEFLKTHGRDAKYTQIVVECAVEGKQCSYYETHSAGLHYEFTRGLGRELASYADVTDVLISRGRGTHPWVFESDDRLKGLALRDALQLVSTDGNVNGKIREAAQRTLGIVKMLIRAVWWSGLCPAGKHGLDYEGQACDLCAISK